MRRVQITCSCSAYSFPHRLGGGKCNGSDWAQFYYLYDMEYCEYCNCNFNSGCDVITGQDKIEHGECYRMLLHYGGHTGYPNTEYV